MDPHTRPFFSRIVRPVRNILLIAFLYSIWRQHRNATRACARVRDIGERTKSQRSLRTMAQPRARTGGMQTHTVLAWPVPPQPYPSLWPRRFRLTCPLTPPHPRGRNNDLDGGPTTTASASATLGALQAGRCASPTHDHTRLTRMSENLATRTGYAFQTCLLDSLLRPLSP